MGVASVYTTSEQHLPELFALYKRYLAREPNQPRITMHVSQFPSAVLVVERRIQGFVYTTDFAPDILELANIFVAPGHRDHGYGGRLVEYVEEAARREFAGIILVNSMLYSSAEQKRPATDFYLKLGYSVVAETHYTGIFYKRL